MSKRTGKTLSVEDKVKLIQEIDAKVCMKKDVAKKYGIPCSTLSTIYKNRDRILKFARQGTESSRKRVKLGKFPQLEEEIYKWILSLSGQNKTLPGTTIRKRAQWLAEQQDYQGFQASVGWLEKFRTRYNLKTQRNKIVLPTEARSLPDSGSVGNEGFILPGNSTEGDIFLESPPGVDIFLESPPGVDIVLELSPEGDIVQESTPRGDIFQVSRPRYRVFGESSPGGAVPQESSPGGAVPQESSPGGAVPQESAPRGDIFQESRPRYRVFGESSPGSDIFQESSPGGAVLQESSPGGADPQKSSRDRRIPCISIKKERIFPYKCPLNPPCPRLPDDDCLWLLTGAIGPRLRRGTASEEIMHRSSNGISGNQPATEPYPHGSSESRPIDVTPSYSGGALKSRSELANASSASSSDFVHENRNGNLMSLISTNQPKDQLECFGNYIVSKLKVMDSRTCLMVQKAINDTIFDAEIRALETTTIQIQVATDNARSSNGIAPHLI